MSKPKIAFLGQSKAQKLENPIETIITIMNTNICR